MKYKILPVKLAEPHFEIVVSNDHNDADYQNSDTAEFTTAEFDFWIELLYAAAQEDHFWRNKEIAWFEQWAQKAIDSKLFSDDMEDDAEKSEWAEFLEDEFCERFCTYSEWGEPHSIESFTAEYFDESNIRHKVAVSP